ncbi:MAG: hypothetical protein WBV94_31295 [Blastocatellia bacterium]
MPNLHRRLFQRLSGKRQSEEDGKRNTNTDACRYAHERKPESHYIK